MACVFNQILPALIVIIAIVAPTSAQSPACYPRDQVARHLENDHGEQIVARGLAASGTLIEVFAAPGGATFSIVATLPRGPSCLVVAGKDWHAVNDPGAEL